MDGTASVSPAAAVPVRMKMPEPITAPIPSAVRLQVRAFAQTLAGLFGAGNQSVDALGAEKAHRLRWPLATFFTFRLFDPRASPAARGGFGAAFLRAARFNSFVPSCLQRSWCSFVCFDPCVFCYDLLQSVTRKADGQLRIFTSPSLRNTVPRPYFGC